MADNIDELIVDVALGRNGRRDYYAGRNIEAEMNAIARGEEKVIKTNKRLSKSNKEVSNSGFALGKSFRFLAAYLATDKLIKYADEWTNIKSVLNLVTNSEKERIAVQERLFAISQKTMQGMSGTVDLYAKITRNAENLNLSQEKRLQLTEAINKALIIGGGSTTSNQAALLQFGQALSMGNLRGQELNSILAQSPRLAQMIAEGMGVKTADLKNMGAKGQLTSDKVIAAILNQTPKVNREFNKMGITVSQAFTKLNNAFGKFINNLNETTGAANILAKGISGLASALEFLADNTEIVAIILGGLLLRKLTILRAVFLESRFAIGTMTRALQVLISGEIINGLKAVGVAGWKAVAPFLKFVAIAELVIQTIKMLKGEWNWYAEAIDDIERGMHDTLNWIGEKTGWWGKRENFKGTFSSGKIDKESGMFLGSERDVVVKPVQPVQTPNNNVSNTNANINQNLTFNITETTNPLSLAQKVGEILSNKLVQAVL